MSILSDWSIEELCNKTNPMIDPFFSTKQVHELSGMSFGLSPASYDFRIAEDHCLLPGGSALASTIEKVNIPDNVCAAVKDKSSWARQFLAVQNTHFDPGFRGTPTLELTNHSHVTIIIRAGTPICQFVFSWLDRAARRPYRGKYQDQAAGPQPWIKETAT